MKRTLILFAVAIAGVALSSTAHAGMMLKIDDGTTFVSVTDGGAGDFNGAVGAITYVGGIGNWTTTVTTGLSDPQLPNTGTNAQMDLNSVIASSTSGGVLHITLFDDGFTLDPNPLSVATLHSNIGGTLAPGGTLSLTQEVTWDQGISSESVTHSFDNSLGGLPFAFSSSKNASLGALALTNPFTIQEYVAITHAAGGSTSFNAASNVVPVPGAVLLGILGLGAAGFKLRRKRA